MRPFYLCSILLLFLPAVAFAHGGAEHEHKTPTPIASEIGSIASAVGSAFELVIKAPPIETGKESIVRLLLADYETNVPIADANLEIEVKGANGFRVEGKAKPTAVAGIYELPITFPEEGSYIFDAIIQSESKADLLTASGFTIKSQIIAIETGFWRNSYSIPIGIAGILISLFIGFLLGRFVQSKQILSKGARP